MTQSTKSPSVLPLSFTRMPFGKYLNQPFDRIPLSYLDWLSGQDWLYGSLRLRLTKYLNKPCIQKELDDELPDPELESSGFTVAGTYGDRSKNAWADYGSEPKPEEPRDWKPRGYSMQTAWTKALDLIEAFEHSRTQEELDGHAREITVQLKLRIPATVVNHMRDVYRKAKQRIATDNRFTPQQWAEAQEALDALDQLDQDAKQEFSAEEALESLQCRRPDLIDAMKQLL